MALSVKSRPLGLGDLSRFSRLQDQGCSTSCQMWAALIIIFLGTLGKAVDIIVESHHNIYQSQSSTWNALPAAKDMACSWHGRAVWRRCGQKRKRVMLAENGHSPPNSNQRTDVDITARVRTQDTMPGQLMSRTDTDPLSF